MIASVYVKLNIGDQGKDHAGYEGVDIKRGMDAAHLDYEDGAADEVRASHILEHFSYGLALVVVSEWVRVLQPGGLLKIAVPDFRKIAEYYLAAAPINFQGYLMGGQVDEYDFHKAIFDEGFLTVVMQRAGIENIQRWRDEIEDCARLPISLNLCGTKR